VSRSERNIRRRFAGYVIDLASRRLCGIVCWFNGPCGVNPIDDPHRGALEVSSPADAAVGASSPSQNWRAIVVDHDRAPSPGGRDRPERRATMRIASA
jgi:hypothetical protein